MRSRIHPVKKSTVDGGEEWASWPALNVTLFFAQTIQCLFVWPDLCQKDPEKVRFKIWSALNDLPFPMPSMISMYGDLLGLVWTVLSPGDVKCHARSRRTHQEAIRNCQAMPVEDWRCLMLHVYRTSSTSKQTIVIFLNALQPNFHVNHRESQMHSQNIDLLKMLDELHLHVFVPIQISDDFFPRLVFKNDPVEHSHPKNKKTAHPKKDTPTQHHTLKPRNVFRSQKSRHLRRKDVEDLKLRQWCFPWCGAVRHCTFIAWPFWCSAAVKNRNWDDIFLAFCGFLLVSCWLHDAINPLPKV